MGTTVRYQAHGPVHSPRERLRCHLYACKASVDMFGLTSADFVDAVDGIITVGEFYQMAAGGQIVST